MKSSNLFSVAGGSAILLGLLKIFSAVGYLLLPADQRATVPAKTFLPAFAQNPGLLTAFFWSEALVRVLGLAIVPPWPGC